MPDIAAHLQAGGDRQSRAGPYRGGTGKRRGLMEGSFRALSGVPKTQPDKDLYGNALLKAERYRGGPRRRKHGSDGLVETRGADLDVGLERLRSALAGPSSSLEALCSHVISVMTPNARPPNALAGLAASNGQWATEDDIALLLARTHTLTREQAAGQLRR